MSPPTPSSNNSNNNKSSSTPSNKDTNSNKSRKSSSNVMSNLVKSVSVPKPRSLYAFIIDFKRWKVPHSIQQLKTRIRTNALFFQTNYFIMSMLCFVLFTILSLKAIVTGLVSGGLIAVAIAFFTDYLPHAHEIKQNHPKLVIVVGVVLIILAWHSIHTLLLVGVALSSALPICLIHSALRDSSNLTSGSESSRNYFSTTPMGRLMSLLGYEATASTSE